MGGGKRKFNKVRKYVPKDKQLGKYTEDKEEKQKNPEDVKGLIDIYFNYLS